MGILLLDQRMVVLHLPQCIPLVLYKIHDMVKGELMRLRDRMF